MKTMYKIQLFILCVLLFQPLSAQIQEAGNSDFQAEKKQLTLSVEDAVSYALRENSDIARSLINLKQTEREYKHSWNNVLPSVSANANGRESQSLKNKESDTVSVEAGASVNLSLDFGLAGKIKSLKASYKAGKTDYEATISNIETEVRKAFYNLLYLKEKLESEERAVESYQRQYEQTQKKYSSGLTSELDLLSAQVNLETARPNVDSAKISYYNALTEFFNTIGLDVAEDTEVILQGSLELAEKIKELDSSLLDNCEETSRDVQKLKNSLQIAQATKEQTFSSTMLPSFSAEASVYPESTSYNKSSGEKSTNPNWSVSLGLKFSLDNLLPGSSAKDNLAKLDDTIKDYKIQLESTKKNVRTQAVEKLKSIELSKQTLKTRQMNLELAEKSFSMMETAYNRGIKDLLSVQNSLDTLKNAELQLKLEQYQLISNVLDLENILSLPSGSLFTSM